MVFERGKQETTKQAKNKAQILKTVNKEKEHFFFFL